MCLSFAVQEFTLNTQLDLERQAAASQSRALVAEEQLQSLQHYISQSTVVYQKEIVRLRAMLNQQQQQQHAGNRTKEGTGQDNGRAVVMRSSSAGAVLPRPESASGRRSEALRPVRSATNGQGQLSRPMNERPAVDAWYA